MEHRYPRPVYLSTIRNRGENHIFHSIAEENEERKLAPISKKGVKFITQLASFLSPLDKRSRDASVVVEAKPEKDSEPRLPSQKRLAEQLHRKAFIATRRALGTA